MLKLLEQQAPAEVIEQFEKDEAERAAAAAADDDAADDPDEPAAGYDALRSRIDAVQAACEADMRELNDLEEAQRAEARAAEPTALPDASRGRRQHCRRCSRNGEPTGPGLARRFKRTAPACH